MSSPSPNQNSPNEVSSTPQKNLGGRRMIMGKIMNQKKLHATFSRRRADIFKKADELNILTGAHIAVVLFSPSGKAYAYGAPNFKSVVNEYYSLFPRRATSNQIPHVQSAEQEREKAQAKCAEKQRETTMLKRFEEFQENHSVKAKFADLDIPELEKLRLNLEILGNKLTARVNNLTTPNLGMAGSFPLPSVAPALEDEGSKEGSNGIDPMPAQESEGSCDGTLDSGYYGPRHF